MKVDPMIVPPAPSSTCSATCRKEMRRSPQVKATCPESRVHDRRRRFRRRPSALAGGLSGLVVVLATTGIRLDGADGASFWFRSPRPAERAAPSSLDEDPRTTSQDDGWEPPLTQQEEGNLPSNDNPVDNDDEYAYPPASSSSATSTSFRRGNLPPPPPPPPPPRNPRSSRGGPSSFEASSLTDPRRQRSANYSPIHYEFKARGDDNAEPRAEDGSVDARQGRRRRSETTDGGNHEGPETASARRDVVTRYMSRPSRALHLRANAAVVGAALGAFVSRSLFASSTTPHPNPWTIPALCFVAFFVTSYFRNPYGELVRALGMTLILVLRQSRQIRKRYPGLRHLQSVLRIQPRAPFPPARNIWSYQPRDGTSDPEFSMLYSLIAMAMVGSLVGGNVPLLPSWIGGLAGGAAFAFATTLPTPNGDLARCMGMRVVAVAQEAWVLQSELRLLSKFGTVTGKIADKLLILDRKHRIKDRVVAGVSFLYEQVLRAAQQQQQQQPESPPPPRERAGDPRDERRRPQQRPPPPPPPVQDYDDYPPSFGNDYQSEPYNRDRPPPPNYSDEDGRGDFGRWPRW